MKWLEGGNNKVFILGALTNCKVLEFVVNR